MLRAADEHTLAALTGGLDLEVGIEDIVLNAAGHDWGLIGAGVGAHGTEPICECGAGPADPAWSVNAIIHGLSNRLAAVRLTTTPGKRLQRTARAALATLADRLAARTITRTQAHQHIDRIDTALLDLAVELKQVPADRVLLMHYVACDLAVLELRRIIDRLYQDASRPTPPRCPHPHP